MERTRIGEVSFYHLDLYDRASGQATALLFGDRAGEDYADTRNDPDKAAAFPELRRADTLTILADGEKLLDSGQRHNVRSELRLTLQAFVDSGVIRKWQRLAIVLTKLDALRGHAQFGSRAESDFDSAVESIRNTIGGHFGDIQAFRVAASPKSGAAGRGEGIDELISYWLQPALRLVPKSEPRQGVQNLRYFGRLQPEIQTGGHVDGR